MTPDGLPHQVIGTEELVSILGPRPYSKSVDYDAFINAAWNPTDAQRAAAAAAAAAGPSPEQHDANSSSWSSHEQHS